MAPFLRGEVGMRIGVIGAGSVGGTLARHLAKLGYEVSIANSRGPESLTALAASGSKIPAVGRRSGLQPPGVVQITTVDRVEAKIVDKAKYCCLGVRRIADHRESVRPVVPLGTPARACRS
jgi:uncharacterized protein YbjT (DUF2867 family)